MSSVESAAALNERKVAPTLNEDWLSVAIGLAVFALALASLAGFDLIGWSLGIGIVSLIVLVLLTRGAAGIL